VTTATPQTLELLQWIDARPRTYVEAIEAWRTNCPRLSVWDDATIDGLIRAVAGRNGKAPTVELTAAGRALLDDGPNFPKPPTT
jgi:hypothetical protein